MTNISGSSEGQPGAHRVGELHVEVCLRRPWLGHVQQVQRGLPGGEVLRRQRADRQG